jgi:hypothetical protein
MMTIVLIRLLPAPLPTPLYHLPVLHPSLHRQHPLSPHSLVLKLSAQHSLDHTDAHSLISIKAYLLQPILIPLTAAPLDPYLYKHISKIALLVVLVALTLYDYLLIISHSRLYMHHFLSMPRHHSLPAAPAAVATRDSPISPTSPAEAYLILRDMHPTPITFLAFYLSSGRVALAGGTDGSLPDPESLCIGEDTFYVPARAYSTDSYTSATNSNFLFWCLLRLLCD